jgi:formylglycine-generating enzyme
VLMRIAMLSALKAADTTRNLGFRCAKDGTQDHP